MFSFFKRICNLTDNVKLESDEYWQGFDGASEMNRKGRLIGEIESELLSKNNNKEYKKGVNDYLDMFYLRG